MIITNEDRLDTLRAGRFTIPVLYADNHLLIAVKPPNMPVQADSSRDTDMLTALKGWVADTYRKPGNVYLGLVHRLDRPVGGVMVFARTSKAAARLSDAFAAHTQDRRYMAVLQGILPGARTLEDELLKGADGMVRVVVSGTKGAKHARLDTEPIAYAGDRTLTRVVLYTGRSHQIRVQHANAGLPLWGDARYGGGRPGQQIALWAYHLSFRHPTKDETVCCGARPPRDGAWASFEAAIEREMRERIDE